MQWCFWKCADDAQFYLAGQSLHCATRSLNHAWVLYLFLLFLDALNDLNRCLGLSNEFCMS